MGQPSRSLTRHMVRRVQRVGFPSPAPQFATEVTEVTELAEPPTHTPFLNCPTDALIRAKENKKAWSGVGGSVLSVCSVAKKRWWVWLGSVFWFGES